MFAEAGWLDDLGQMFHSCPPLKTRGSLSSRGGRLVDHFHTENREERLGLELFGL